MSAGFGVRRVSISCSAAGLCLMAVGAQGGEISSHPDVNLIILAA